MPATIADKPEACNDFVEDYIGEADERLNERGIIGETKKSHLYKHFQKINHVSLSCID